VYLKKKKSFKKKNCQLKQNHPKSTQWKIIYFLQFFIQQHQLQHIHFFIQFYSTFSFICHNSDFKIFFFPAAEVVKQNDSLKQRRDLLVPNTTSVTQLPSPILSPSFSSDEDSVYSPSTIVNQDFQLDDLFDWDGQQQVAMTTNVTF